MKATYKLNICYLAVLFLSAEIALLYPAHVVLDHTGLFHHHNVEDLPHDEADEDDCCLICINVYSMEDLKSGFISSIYTNRDINSELNDVTRLGKVRLIVARAPPLFFSNI